MCCKNYYKKITCFNLNHDFQGTAVLDNFMSHHKSKIRKSRTLLSNIYIKLNYLIHKYF